MPTVRGFVQRIEIGRAGLATVTLVHDDATTSQVVISDLDADPERFNERLSKLGVLRDAMDRAEPVEVEWVEGRAGREVDRAARITRDALQAPQRIEVVTGLVLDLTVLAQNRTGAAAEAPDAAVATLLTSALALRACVLLLQAPERLVAQAQLDMLRQAQDEGRTVRLMLDTAGPDVGFGTGAGTGTGTGAGPGVVDGTSNTVNVGERGAARIIAVALDAGGAAGDDDGAREVNGFVESLSLLRPPVPPTAAVGTFAHVRLTTAPPFTGAGNVVAMSAFTPETLDLLTPKGSLAYQLFEAALRDGLRVRARAAIVGRDPQQPTPTEPTPNQPTPNVPGAGPTRPVVRAPSGASEERNEKPEGSERSEKGEKGEKGEGGAADARADYVRRASQLLGAAAGATATQIGIAFGVELLAPLASASRPVWVAVERRQLDLGPEGDRCVLGSPTSDLTPRGIRDLRLPYPARWCGHGCFNAGVYRFQLRLASAFTLTVDGEEVCLHDADGGVRIGHACLDYGCHEVCVMIEAWTCDSDFVMDVYRLR